MKNRNVMAVVVISVAALMLGASSAVATGGHHDKVLVCKYVGTPGVDERLKEGKNPIEVAHVSTQSGWFNDKHGRSYVLTNGETCPVVTTPTPDPEPEMEFGQQEYAVAGCEGDQFVTTTTVEYWEREVGGEKFVTDTETTVTSEYDPSCGEVPTYATPTPEPVVPEVAKAATPVVAEAKFTG